MASEIAAIYRASKKKQDINWFTEHIARPPAAVVVYALRNTRITPNQVTFASALIAAGAGVMLALLRGWTWLVVAALVFEFSFVLDCADGQRDGTDDKCRGPDSNRHTDLCRPFRRDRRDAARADRHALAQGLDQPDRRPAR